MWAQQAIIDISCGRICHGVGAAVIALLLGAPAAHAALITDVADAADTVLYGGDEREDFFDLYSGAELTFEWATGRISREPITPDPKGCSEATPRRCLPVDELRYSRQIHRVNVRSQIGLFHDLALTIDLPIYLGDTIQFDYAKNVDATTSTVDGNGGTLFDHKSSARRTGIGRLELGVLFGALNDERDETKPSWVIGVAWQMPFTAGVYEPGVSTRATKKSPGRIGDGVHRIVFKTALSRRIGNFGLIGIDEKANRRGYTDPYLELAYTLPVAQSSSPAPLNPKNDFGALPSHVVRLKAGIEVVPYEKLSEQKKISVDLGLRAAFFSEGRDYTLVSDALGEFNYTEQFFQVGALVGFYAQPMELLRFRLTYNLMFASERFLTYENVGIDGSPPGSSGFGQVSDDDPEDQRNPYWTEYDQVGRRFKAEGSVHHLVSVAVELTL